MSIQTRDLALAALLLTATIVYLSFWPLDFYGFDEGIYLYEAKRVLDGAVMYRDFFDILTPGWFYAMAGVFALFGVSMEVARAAMSVVHGLIAVLVFAICRHIGVRPALALLLGAAHIALDYPAVSIATPHWLSTLVTLILLMVVLRWPATKAAPAVLWGVIVGLLILIQQQKGAPMAMGVAALVGVDALLAAPRPWLGALVRRLAWYAAGLLALTVPVMLAFVVTAGFDEVFRALVRYPLVNYRGLMGSFPSLSWRNILSWGAYYAPILPQGFINQRLPTLIPLGVAWCVWLWRNDRAGSDLRRAIVVVLFSIVMLWSISYSPDSTHFAYVAPIWFVLAGMLVESGLRAISGRLPYVNAAAHVVVCVLAVACCWLLASSLQSRRERCKVPAYTVFGRNDLVDSLGGAAYAWLTELFRNEHVKEIFVYPASPGLYLLTGTENATRYQIVLGNYTDNDAVEEVVHALETRKVEFIVRHFYPGLPKLQRLNSYVEANYDRVPLPDVFRTSNITHLFRRKAEAPGRTKF